MNKNVSSEYGCIRIHKKAIAQIAEKAAYEVTGVKAAGSDCRGWLGKVLHLLGFSATKVSLDSETKGGIKIVIPIKTAWGVNIVDVAYETQKQIISHMLNDLNIDNLTVDIKVKDLA